MSRRPLSSTQAFPGAGSANDIGKLVKTVLAKVKNDGTIDLNSAVSGTLELNPESWEESIVTNWVPHAIPGQSSPIFQWVSGGPRTVTFDALVTKDTSEFLNKPVNPLAALADAAINAVGTIASSFLGVNLPPIGDLLGGFTSGSGEELGIHNNLDYYRSLCYPKYVDGIVDSSPPLIALYAGKTFNTQLTDPGTDSISPDTTVWILVDLKIRITKQLPNLTPMEAMVSFRLMQYPFKAIDASAFGAAEVPAAGPAGLDASLGGLLA